ncbi:MAG: hypothetical protein IPN76_34060 [Saprospiraceae bacterium]|nr:hypothetical protein [Saprospiraceae bacterium]
MKIFELFFACIFGILVFSCKKDDDTQVVTPPPVLDVYVAGDEISDQGISIPKIWKNGKVFQILTDGSEDEYLADMTISPKNEVYAVGWQREFNTQNYDENAIIWKDGVGARLNVGGTVLTRSVARAVHVDSNDVYVAGYISGNYFLLGVDTSFAVLWKNGVPIPLTDGKKSASASSLFVQNGDVYVGGSEKNSQGYTIAKFWKNGVPTILSTSTAWVNAIYAAGDDVYVVLYEDSIHKLWKNGVKTNLTGTPQDIKVVGTDVYIAGNDGNIAKFWKNGVPTSLSDGLFPAFGHSVYVSESDVYVAGSEQDGNGGYAAKLWKNGVEVPLELDGANKGSYAVSVMVK